VPDRPEVAVVVGAYGRERFLVPAVRSVLAQTLPRERFEVVVTKNFARPEVDRFLEEHRVVALRDDEPRVGTWLLHAVAATRAPYIAFLDDDDEFEPEHLARAVSVLRSDPTIGFYRNRVRVIDEQGNPTPPSSWRSHEVDAFFDAHGPVTVRATEKSHLGELGLERTRVSFNSSTMVVRRELFDGDLGEAFARIRLSPDIALFALAALGPYALFFDDRRLTRYRYYAGGVTRRVSWLEQVSAGYAELAALARRYGNADLARRLAAESEHYDRLFRSGTIVEKVGAGADRREVARLAEEYLRFLGQHPAERALTLDVWAAEVYATSYLFAPGVARRVSLRQAARRGA